MDPGVRQDDNQLYKSPLIVYDPHRITNGFGTSVAVEIQTLFV